MQWLVDLLKFTVVTILLLMIVDQLQTQFVLLQVIEKDLEINNALKQMEGMHQFFEQEQGTTNEPAREPYYPNSGEHYSI